MPPMDTPITANSPTPSESATANRSAASSLCPAPMRCVRRNRHGRPRTTAPWPARGSPQRRHARPCASPAGRGTTQPAAHRAVHAPSTRCAVRRPQGRPLARRKSLQQSGARWRVKAERSACSTPHVQGQRVQTQPPVPRDSRRSDASAFELSRRVGGVPGRIERPAVMRVYGLGELRRGGVERTAIGAFGLISQGSPGRRLGTGDRAC